MVNVGMSYYIKLYSIGFHVLLFNRFSQKVISLVKVIKCTLKNTVYVDVIAGKYVNSCIEEYWICYGINHATFTHHF